MTNLNSVIPHSPHIYGAPAMVPSAVAGNNCRSNFNIDTLFILKGFNWINLKLNYRSKKVAVDTATP
jgi:hypothetical protein